MGQFDAFEGTYDFEWDTDGHIPFYTGLAAEAGGPVLEFACGTGRLLIPIAREGTEAWGVQHPGPMAARFGRRLMDEKAEVRDLIHLVEHDPTTADLGHTFRMVFVAFAGLQLYLEEARLGALLDNLARHLGPGGVAAFDLIRPSESMLRNPGMLHHAWTMERPRMRETISRFDAMSVDATDRRLDVTIFLDCVDETGQISRRVVQQVMRMVEVEEIEALLAAHGLQVDGVYGSGSRAELAPSDDSMFVIAHKRQI